MARMLPLTLPWPRSRLPAAARRRGSWPPQRHSRRTSGSRSAYAGAPAACGRLAVRIACRADLQRGVPRSAVQWAAAHRALRRSWQLRALAAANVCLGSSRRTLGVDLIEISVSVSAWCQSTVQVSGIGSKLQARSVLCVRDGAGVDILT
jgi:hypothetical protein